MKTQKVKLKELTSNPNNPRVMRGNGFEKLLKSLKEFPSMMHARPIVVDEDGVILGGNMRAQALEELGHKEVEVYRVTGWSDQQKKEFVIKDNLNFGEWDYDVLANEWEALELESWGLDVWTPEKEIDFSLLDNADEVSDMADDVRRAICIDFSQDDHAVAAAIVAGLKKEGKDVGKMLLKWLQKT